MSGFLTDNLPLKIIALIIALVLYLFVMQEKEGVREFLVNLDVVEPPGFVLMNDMPTLRVAVAGRTRNLTDLEGDQLNRLELRPESNETQRWFEPKDLDLPPGLEVRSIYPEYVQLNFARLVTKEVPILASIDGQPAAGYSFSYEVHPTTITVEGPEVTVSQMNAILTETVDVTDLDDSASPYTFNVGLTTRRARVTYDTQVDVFVVVRVEVDEATTTLVIPVVIEGPTERFSIDRDYLTIRVTGPAASIDALDASAVTARVDVADQLDIVEESRFPFEPEILNLPSDVRVEADAPLTVWVTGQPPETRYAFVAIPFPNFLPVPLPALNIPPTATENPEPE